MNGQPNPLAGAVFHHSPHRGKAVCELGWNWCPRALSDYDLWYVVSGKGTMEWNGTTVPLAKGACFLFQPGDTPHAEQDADDRLTVIFIHFHATGLRDGLPVGSLAGLPRHTGIADTFAFEALLGRMLMTLELKELWMDEEFDSLLKLALYHFMRAHLQAGETSGVSRQQKQTAARVTAYIREQGGRRIPREELAELVGLSPEYLSVLYKRTTGSSLKETMTAIRLERARHLLAETSMNVSQIADVLGYANSFLFSRQFKQHFGSPPSRFRMDAVRPRSHGAPGSE